MTIMRSCRTCGCLDATEWKLVDQCANCYGKARRDKAVLRPGICSECGPTAHKRWLKQGTICGRCYGRLRSAQDRARNSAATNAASRRYRRANPDRRLITTQAWRKRNPVANRAIQKRARDKYRATVRGQLDHRMEVAIRNVLCGRKRRQSWVSLVGYSVEDLKAHLEALFVDGMTWARFMAGEIHIDHKKPKSKFQYESAADPVFRECWGLQNLQPLWAADNLRKNAK